MKTSDYPHHHQKAFTLIELLIVIGIIALLAGLCGAVGSKALEKARIFRANAAISQLLIAIKSYQSDYNRYPVSSGQTSDITIDTSETEGKALLSSLLAKDVADNPNRTMFYEPHIAKDGTNGYDPTSGVVFDPWGKGYKIVIDYNRDGMLENPYPSSGGTAEIPSGVLIYSYGPNKMLDDSPGKTDDLKSWQ